MPDSLLLCVIPAERAGLVPTVLAAGATPVVDLTCSSSRGGPDAAALPEGVWVRVRAGQEPPGLGPVLLAEGDAPIPGRATWREVTVPCAAPPGFAGVVLRGVEAGGRSGDRAGLDMLSEVPARTPVILDAGLSPEEASRAIGAGAVGVVLSDALLVMPELALPEALSAAALGAGPDSTRRVAGVRLLAPSLAPVLRRISAGASLWDEAQDWFTADNPAETAVPVGQAVALGRALLNRTGGLPGAIAAYRAAMRAGQREAAAPVVSAVMPVLHDLVAAVAAALALPGDGAPAAAAPSVAAAMMQPEVEVLCTGLSVGLPGGERVFSAHNLAVLARGDHRLIDGSGLASGHRVGRPGALDPGADYGLTSARASAMDPIARLAVAAGLEALADAGLPLIADPTGTLGRALPSALRPTTGVIFASGLPGLVRMLLSQGETAALTLMDAHAALADLLGVTGPTLAVNAGAASAAVALATASDWLRLGRAERVLVVAADDLADDVLLESFGRALLHEGRALSVGAAGFVLETGVAAARRGAGVRARLSRSILGAEVDQLPDELHGQVLAVGEPAAARLVGRAPAARLAGESQAEAFAGYALGAGLDDALAVLAVCTPSVVGAKMTVDTALRAALGVGGSLVALLWDRSADHDAAAIKPWLTAVTGLKSPELVTSGRVLYAVERGAAAPAHPAPVVTPAPAVLPTSPPLLSPLPAPTSLLAPLPAALPEEQAEPEAMDPPEQPIKPEAQVAPEAPAQPEAPPQPAAPAPLVQAAAPPPEPERPVTPTPRTPDPAPRTAARAADPAPRPSARLTEDHEDRASSKLAAWSRRVKSKRRKGSDNAAATDWIGQARARVLRELLTLIAHRRGENSTLPSATQRLGADLSFLIDEQAALLVELGERYDLDLETSDALVGDPSISQLVHWMVDEARQVWKESPEAPAGVRRLFAFDENVNDEPSAGETTDQIEVRPTAPVAARPAAPEYAPSADPSEAVAQLVAAEVGYRPEELLPNLELEGDLGLDASVQARIIETLRRRFNLGAPTLEDPVTLASLAGWVGQGPVAMSEAPEDAAPIAAGPAPGRSSAQVAQAAPPEAQLGPPEPPPEDDDSAEVPAPPSPRTPRPIMLSAPGSALPESFRVRRPIRVDQALTAVGSVKGRVVKVLGDGALATALREELSARGATAEGAVEAVVDAGEDLSASYEAALALCGQPPRDWLALSHAADAAAGDPLAVGAREGLAKALCREWPGCRARAVRISAELDRSEAVMVALEELASGDDALEVFRGAGTRQTVALSAEPLPPRIAPDQDRSTVLIAGGTRGVGAQLALALARRGERLVLVARTSPARKPYDEAGARAAVERGLRARGRRPSETRILRGLEPYRMAEEARLTVARLREAGAEVLFIKADLADPTSAEAALAEVQRLVGALDGLVVALPMGETLPLSERDASALAPATAPRIKGVNLLRQALSSEGWLLSVGGIAGRFGQAGRVEICAGLQAMASLAESIPRALHVSCPAWGDGGRSDEAPGADVLPVEAGAELLLDLCASGATGERVLSGRLGGGLLNPGHPLLEGMDVDGDAVEVWCDLSPDEAPWLAEYAPDGVPQLPISVAVELLCAAACATAPGLPCVGFRGLRTLEPLSIPLGERARIQVLARPTADGAVRATLTSTGGADGPTTHAEILVSLREGAPASILPSAFFPEESIARNQIYRRFFQGSTFQVLRDAGAVAAEGLLVDAVVEHAMLALDLISAPLVLEAAIQGALLHHMAVNGARATPVGVDGAWYLRSPPDGDLLELMVQRVDDAWDIDVHGPEGAVMRVRGLRLRDTGALSPVERFPEPEGGWPSAVVGLALG